MTEITNKQFNRKLSMYGNNKQTVKQGGFTLIELIISMLIFSIISLISYSALQAYTTNQKLVFEHFEEISDLQKTILFVKRDVNQIFNQNIELQGNVLTFSSLQNDEVFNIRYSVQDGNLVREDITDIDNVVSLTLLEDVEKFGLLLSNNSNESLKVYKKTSAVYIKTLQLSFEHKYWGEIKQLVLIGE